MQKTRIFSLVFLSLVFFLSFSGVARADVLPPQVFAPGDHILDKILIDANGEQHIFGPLIFIYTTVGGTDYTVVMLGYRVTEKGQVCIMGWDGSSKQVKIADPNKNECIDEKKFEDLMLQYLNSHARDKITILNKSVALYGSPPNGGFSFHFLGNGAFDPITRKGETDGPTVSGLINDKFPDKGVHQGDLRKGANGKWEFVGTPVFSSLKVAAYPPKIALNGGGDATAEPKDQNGQKFTGLIPAIKWTSGTCVGIDEKGHYSGNKVGDCDVIATSGKVVGKAGVTVVSGPFLSVTLVANPHAPDKIFVRDPSYVIATWVTDQDPPYTMTYSCGDGDTNGPIDTSETSFSFPTCSYGEPGIYFPNIKVSAKAPEAFDEEKDSVTVIEKPVSDDTSNAVVSADPGCYRIPLLNPPLQYCPPASILPLPISPPPPPAQNPPGLQGVPPNDFPEPVEPPDITEPGNSGMFPPPSLNVRPDKVPPPPPDDNTPATDEPSADAPPDDGTSAPPDDATAQEPSAPEPETPKDDIGKFPPAAEEPPATLEDETDQGFLCPFFKNHIEPIWPDLLGPIGPFICPPADTPPADTTPADTAPPADNSPATGGPADGGSSGTDGTPGSGSGSGNSNKGPSSCKPKYTASPCDSNQIMTYSNLGQNSTQPEADRAHRSYPSLTDFCKDIPTKQCSPDNDCEKKNIYCYTKGYDSKGRYAFTPVSRSKGEPGRDGGIQACSCGSGISNTSTSYSNPNTTVPDSATNGNVNNSYSNPAPTAIRHSGGGGSSGTNRTTTTPQPTAAPTAAPTATSGTVPDTTPPTVSITYPASDATVSGIVTVSISASDNVGVAKADFYIDDSFIGNDTSAPFSYSFNPGSAGEHILTVLVYDLSNNPSSDSVSFSTSGGGATSTIPPTVTAAPTHTTAASATAIPTYSAVSTYTTTFPSYSGGGMVSGPSSYFYQKNLAEATASILEAFGHLLGF
ncbi:MAG: Ig-like domain-containing protein [Candidatus Pacebacteria bacterium]|nr:Ig-like domain-containing protein [Candidatus Paceibacterota bacterium]